MNRCPALRVDFLMWYCVAILCSGAVTMVRAQGGAGPSPQELYQQAMAAHGEQDWATFLARTRQLAAALPGHPTVIYNLAAGYALNDQPDSAVVWLSKYADMGLGADAAADTDFASVLEYAAFQQVLAQLARNREPVGDGRMEFVMGERDFLPEGLAYDPVTRTFFVGSVRQRKIMSVRLGGPRERTQPADFSCDEDGLWSVFGMRVDPEHHQLWVCSSAVSQMQGFTEEDRGRAGLFLYDLETGALVNRYPAPVGKVSPEAEPVVHLFGDLVVSSTGDVYLTDTVEATVYVLRAGADELELLVPAGTIVSPQGLTFGRNEDFLFVADYVRGIFRIDLRTEEAELLPYPENAALRGIDGLYYHDGSLVAIQNGTNPHRILRLDLDPEEQRVIGWSVVAANLDGWKEPTLGVVVDSTLYYIANSQWGSYHEDGRPRESAELKSPVIMAEGL